MATKGKFSLYTESRVHTFARVEEARKAYAALFHLEPQVYVRGTFKWQGRRMALPWTPVEVVSTGFRTEHGDHLAVVPGYGFQFALFQPGQDGPDGALHG